MDIKFNNEVSYADIVATVGAIATAGWMLVVISSDITTLQVTQMVLVDDVSALEARNHAENTELSKAIEELRKDTARQLQVLDAKGEQRHDKAMTKLDTLINRELEMLMNKGKK